MFFCYKGRPLVRLGDIIYYGNMKEGCVVKLRIKSNQKVKDLPVAKEVSVQLLNTEPDVPPQEQIVKATEKIGLYQALDIGTAWIDKYAIKESK